MMGNRPLAFGVVGCVLVGCFVPHISVWGSSFVGCHPARIRPSFLPSVLLAPSSTHSLARSLARSLTHSPTHSLTHPLTHSLTHSLTHCTLTLPAVSRDLVTHSLTHSFTHSIPDSGSLRSVQRLQKGLRRSVQRLQKALSAVSGAVFRDCRRASGARGRRWAPGGSVRYCHCDLQSNGCDRLRIAL